MKKIKVIGAVIGSLLVGALNCSAFKQEVPPSPVEATSGIPTKHSDYSVTSDSKTFDNVFVGHYGEVFHFNYLYAAEPEMKNLMEVVRFHELQVKNKNGTFVPFEPKIEEYIPRNFTPMRLGQLIVIPKDAPNGFRSLTELRKVKEKELAASGFGYEMRVFSFDRDYWPDETFEVLTSTPYRLYQLYSQSDKNFFILTSGIVDPLSPTSGDLRGTYDSLQEYLAQFRRKDTKEYLVYKYPRLAIPWVLIIVIAGTLGLFPGRDDGWRRRLRLAGRATLVFSVTLPVLGLVAVYIGWSHRLDKWVNMGSISLCLAAVLPFVCAAMSAWLGGKRLRRAFLWMAGVNLLPALAAFTVAFTYFHGFGRIDSREFVGVCSSLIFLGFLDGIAFGLTHTESDYGVVSDGASR